MKTVYLQELKKYSKSELVKLLHWSESEVNDFIELTRLWELVDVIKNKQYYSFRFVGIVCFEDRVILFLPKYFKKCDPRQTMKQIISLFREFTRRESLDKYELDTFGDLNRETTKSLFALIDFLIEDYLENGLYSNEQVIVETNGTGSIDWVTTLTEHSVYVTNGRPIFLDVSTSSVISNEQDYIRELHMFVLNNCSSILKTTGLGYFFGYPDISFDLSENFVQNSDDMLGRLEREILYQFSDRKILLLSALHAFISRDLKSSGHGGFALYGTRSFYRVWEKVCSFVFGDQYELFSQYIEKPRWYDNSAPPTSLSPLHSGTLEPDILRPFYHEEERWFFIFDAKYYDFRVEGNRVHNTPGIESITKQYLYRLALREELAGLGYDYIVNAFIFPCEDGEFRKLGYVNLSFLANLGLEDIELYAVPTEYVFDLYVKHKELPTSYLLKWTGR
ncbi:MAG: LlaJI family restriction endonuclease [Firmicutes bacterium]|nr:LlaJI family restriction endonuclease [Bacillota bacterium]